MSKENVALFSKAITKDSELNRRISEAEPTVEAWVRIAHDAGFEFTAEEFAEVVGDTLGRKVSTNDAVAEYLGARYTMGPDELADKSLEQVVGGLSKRSLFISNL